MDGPRSSSPMRVLDSQLSRPVPGRFYSRYIPTRWIAKFTQIKTKIAGIFNAFPKSSPLKPVRNTMRTAIGDRMSIHIEQNLNGDGIDRRGFLKCMAWAGTGTLCVVQGGVLKSFALENVLRQRIGNLKGDLSFVQLSD